MTLQNKFVCSTISDERKRLLDEAFSLLMKMDEGQIVSVMKEMEEASNGSS